MKLLWLSFCLLPALSTAQTSPLTEDRVQVIVNQQAQAVETRLAEQQAKQLDLYKQDFELRARAVEQELSSLYKIGSVIAALLGIGVFAVFWGAVHVARNYAVKRIEQEVDLAIYKLDPRRWKIRIPRQNFDAERKRLEALKYRHLEPYAGLSAQCREGITVYRAVSDKDLSRLKTFMVDEHIDPLKCCFVIYCTEQARLDAKLLAPFDNFVLSNMPSTLSSQIFAASRNITDDD